MSRHGRALVVAFALLVLAGCQGPDDPGTATPAASGADSCNHPPDTGGGDMGLGAGFDYTDEHHDFGDTAPMTLCMYVPEGDVRVTGSAAHIVAAPEIIRGPGTRFAFTVTVTSGPAGELDLALVDERGDGSAHFHGPAIQTDDTGWYFGAEHGTAP